MCFDIGIKLLLVSSPQTQHAAGALQAVLRGTSNLLSSLCRTTDDGIAALGKRAGLLRYVATLVVLALALGAVDALLGGHVADGLGEAALPELAGDEVVHAVLESIDLLDAGDLGLVEVV